MLNEPLVFPLIPLNGKLVVIYFAVCFTIQAAHA